MARLHGLDQVGFATKVMQHPAYDAFWQDQAVDKILGTLGVTVPVMLVHSLWDQEDIYGNIAVWKALNAPHADTSNLFLVLGPWYHHQERLDGSHVGAIEFGSDTAAYFRLHILRPFLDHYLKDDAPPIGITPVTAFETGTNRWESLKTWPRGAMQRLYLRNGGGLGFGTPGAAPRAGTPDFDAYVSDPAKPIPYIPRPIHIDESQAQSRWQTWLVSDQRDVASRTDVLSFSTPVLTAPLTISGEPIANLMAATSGTDGDFVVKLIDVYPDEVGRDPEMGGYQLMVAADIFRGRYRNSLSNPQPIPADQKQTYRFALPTSNHVFLPGHKIMVQVQSSWFPLYDRNPQTYVDNIFFAKPADYKKATIKVFDAGPSASFIELPVVGNSN
jgi:putative CocE/NonD family hydrolase